MGDVETAIGMLRCQKENVSLAEQLEVLTSSSSNGYEVTSSEHMTLDDRSSRLLHQDGKLQNNVLLVLFGHLASSPHTTPCPYQHDLKLH